MNTVGANMIDFPMVICGSPHFGTAMADLPGPHGIRRAAPGVLLDLPAKPRGLVGRPLSKKELAEFAAAAFEWLAVGQALIALALVPALVAGTVAEERSRRTLPGLLASRLSSAAIILDKLGSADAPCRRNPGRRIADHVLVGSARRRRSSVCRLCVRRTFPTAFFLAALGLCSSRCTQGDRGARSCSST